MNPSNHPSLQACCGSRRNFWNLSLARCWQVKTHIKNTNHSKSPSLVLESNHVFSQSLSHCLSLCPYLYLDQNLDPCASPYLDHDSAPCPCLYLYLCLGLFHRVSVIDVEVSDLSILDFCFSFLGTWIYGNGHQGIFPSGVDLAIVCQKDLKMITNKWWLWYSVVMKFHTQSLSSTMQWCLYF